MTNIEEIEQGAAERIAFNGVTSREDQDVLALVAEVRRLRAIAHNDGVVKEAAHGVIEHTDAENARLTHVLGIQNAALLAYIQKYKPDALPGDDIAEVVTRDAEQLRAENARLRKSLKDAYLFIEAGPRKPTDVDVREFEEVWERIQRDMADFKQAQPAPAETAPQDAPEAAWTPQERSHIRVTETGEKGIIFQVFDAPLLGRTLYRVEHTNGEYSDYERDEIERDE